MEKIIRVSILRLDRPPCRLSEEKVYEVQADREMTVLEILHHIYRHLDPTIAYRSYRCGRRICRSCEVKLDGKIVRGCATLLQPGKSYRLESARPEAVIRDLVFAFDAPCPPAHEILS